LLAPSALNESFMASQLPVAVSHSL
jgi:hypothetical protein